jgi:hypothetical protein
MLWCQRLTDRDRGSERATRPSRRPAQRPFIRSWRGRDTGHGSGSVGAQPPTEEEEDEEGTACGLWLSGLASSGSLVFVSPVFPSLAAGGLALPCRAIAPIRPRANECGRLRSRVRVACAVTVSPVTSRLPLGAERDMSTVCRVLACRAWLAGGRAFMAPCRVMCTRDPRAGD